LAVAAVCRSLPIIPNPASPPTVVDLQPGRAWTDTTFVVARGERSMFAATGEIAWAAAAASGPDGLHGVRAGR
jgi:hypothetical protein